MFSGGEGCGSKFIVNLPAYVSTTTMTISSKDIENNGTGASTDMMKVRSRSHSQEGIYDIYGNLALSTKSFHRSTSSKIKGSLSRSRDDCDGFNGQPSMSVKSVYKNDEKAFTISSKQTLTENDFLFTKSFKIRRDRLDTLPLPIPMSDKNNNRLNEWSIRASSKKFGNQPLSLYTPSLKGTTTNVKFMSSSKTFSTKFFAEDTINFHNSNIDKSASSSSSSSSVGIAIIPEQRQRHVMVVDDSAATRKMLIRLLVPLGFKVTEAKDGLDCLRLCQCPCIISVNGSQNTIESSLSNNNNNSTTIEYDAILIDDSMPNMHGPEAIAILRRHGYHRLILGLTGSIDEETKLKFTSSGANEVLTKPLDMDKLKQVLNLYQILN